MHGLEFDVAHMLSGGLVLGSFLMLYQERMPALINALAVQADGKVILGGNFTSYSGLVRTNLTRLNTDGTVDTGYNPFAGANNPVLALALQPDGKVVAGGEFNLVNTTVRNFVARLNTDGTLDAGFNPGTGADARVRALAIQGDGKIVIGGDFQVISGTARGRVARLNSDGTLDTGYGSGLSGADNSVNTIALTAGGQAVIGGAFQTVNGTGRNYIAQLTTTGALDGTFDPGAGMDAFVSAVAVQGNGRVVVGGGFGLVNNQVRGHVARLNANGSLDPQINFGTGTEDVVNTVLVESYDDRLILGGQFTNYNGTVVDRLVRINGRNNAGAGTLALAHEHHRRRERDPRAVLGLQGARHLGASGLKLRHQGSKLFQRERGHAECCLQGVHPALRGTVTAIV